MTTQTGTHAHTPAAQAVLGKSARENFPVAPRFLPREWRDGLMAVYGFARLVDDIGDGDLAPGAGYGTDHGKSSGGRHGDGDHGGDGRDDGREAVLDAVEADLRRVFASAGRPPGHPLLRSLVPVVRRHGLTPEPFLALIEANRRDQRVHRYATYGELLGYCELSANPVGRLVLAITGASTPERVHRSDAVCTALQIVEHLQDVAEDLGRDRVYLPAEDMKRFRVTEADLAASTASASVRALVAFEAERALRLLAEGVPLAHSVRGRLRLLLAGFTAGGRAAVRAVRDAGYDVLPGPPRPTTRGFLYEATAILRREG